MTVGFGNEKHHGRQNHRGNGHSTQNTFDDRGEAGTYHAEFFSQRIPLLGIVSILMLFVTFFDQSIKLVQVICHVFCLIPFAISFSNWLWLWPSSICSCLR